MTTKIASRGISDAEKLFIFGGITVGCRGDGRNNSDFRPVKVDFANIEGAFGSCRIVSASHDIITAVKGTVVYNENSDELVPPFKISVTPSVTSATYYSIDELDTYESIAITLQSAFNQSFQSNMPSCLKIVPGQSYWQLCVDILLLRFDGNLYDLCGLAAKLALLNTELPKLTLIENDFGQKDFDIPNEADVSMIKLCDQVEFASAIPTFVTVNRISSYCVLDCDQLEEICSNCRFILAFNQGVLAYMSKEGDGCFGPQTMSEVLDCGSMCSKKLELNLTNALKQSVYK